ncbi:MAG: WecB/TagA/CpsF family glycosyltransferase [Pseudomonadota bacterium]
MDWTKIGPVRPGERHQSVTVNVASVEALLGDLASRLAAGDGFSLATLNLDHVVKLRGDPAFRAAYAAQTHITADGNPIVWFSRLARQPIARIPGSDLVVPLASLAAELGQPVALFGSTPASLSAAAEALQRAVPSINIVARIAPPSGFDPGGGDAAKQVEALRKTGARLVFVALGAPKQELFVARAAQEMPQAGFASIGAGLDFLSGTQRRAPRFVQAMAAEWLWRAAADPRRLTGRYISCLAILPAVARAALRQRAWGRP